MELHQSSDHVSVTLTAIAAFTVGECSILADSVVAIEGSDPMEGELKSLFDNIPWDTVILANEMFVCSVGDGESRRFIYESFRYLE